MMYGFYSQTSVDLGHGTTFWTKEDGTEIEVSIVYNSEQQGRENYKWPDAEYLGPVVAWKRNGKTNADRIDFER
jgi:hypothetical protein